MTSTLDHTIPGATPGGSRLAESDRDVALIAPATNVEAPEVSIVIPAMNEEVTVGDFVDWCHQGLAAAGVAGEVLIVDSSSDRTAEIAIAHGARVLRTPKRGLGRAYIDALPYIRGRYIIMGDADCTYDFRELDGFVERFRDGYEYVMGSRWKGSIEPGSMPPLHRYLGTPVTTWMLNVLYASRFSDIHCGMRGITREALERMELQSQSWEYASEMVLKSVHMRLRTAEVPVRFFRDREGRVSHHRRMGWFSPFEAAWINMRAMFVYGAEFFLYRPGIVMVIVGLAITLPLSLGPITLGGVHLSLYSMLLGVMITILGLQGFFLGCIAQVLHDYTGRARRRWLTVFPYTRSVVISGLSIISGLVPLLALLVRFFHDGLSLSPDRGTHLAVAGLLFVIAGFMMFTSTLLLHATALRSGSIYGDHR